MSDQVFVGVDFGTTNSAVAVADSNRRSDLVGVAENGDPTFRSILFFDSEEKGSDRRARCDAGQMAIDRALDPLFEGRLIQSIKSYLTNVGFSGTSIYGNRYALADLVALILDRLRVKTEERIGIVDTPIVAGRPARFVGTTKTDTEDLALTRLQDAYKFAGFPEVSFEFEPVAAAYSYALRLDADELVLIADFGGGTSDFCLLTVGPSLAERAAQQEAIIGVDGVGIAGDAFDARIVEHCVAPQLGRGSDYRAPSGKQLPMPHWIYDQLKAWHKLSFINNRRTHQMLDEVIAGAEDPAAISALKKLLQDNLGFHLYQSVEKAKHKLSSQSEVDFSFDLSPIILSQRIQRTDFEQWIMPELKLIEECVDGLMNKHNLTFVDVDRVFMTGGSSFIPAVRNVFEKRFGADKLTGGQELTSIASGLALVAHDRYVGS